MTLTRLVSSCKEHRHTWLDYHVRTRENTAVHMPQREALEEPVPHDLGSRHPPGDRPGPHPTQHSCSLGTHPTASFCCLANYLVPSVCPPAPRGQTCERTLPPSLHLQSGVQLSGCSGGPEALEAL